MRGEHSSKPNREYSYILELLAEIALSKLIKNINESKNESKENQNENRKRLYKITK